MKKSVIIVAGGSGVRMGSDTPKQFLLLEGKPILFHTLECFHNALPEADLIVVLPKAEMARWKVMSYDTAFHKIKTAEGGSSRFDSVKAGLNLVNGGLVGVHDAVRPLVSEKCILDAFDMAEDKGSAIPVVEMKDSLRKIEGSSSQSRIRSEYCLVQTPQCFDAEKLKRAYEQEFETHFTDDASVFESAGNQINLVAGNSENIKITTPNDLVIAKALLSHLH